MWGFFLRFCGLLKLDELLLFLYELLLKLSYRMEWFNRKYCFGMYFKGWCYIYMLLMFVVLVDERIFIDWCKGGYE